MAEFRIFACVTYEAGPEQVESQFPEPEYEIGWVAVDGADHPIGHGLSSDDIRAWEVGKAASLRIIGEGKTVEEAAYRAMRWVKENGFKTNVFERVWYTTGKGRTVKLHFVPEVSSVDALGAMEAMAEKMRLRKRKHDCRADIWNPKPVNPMIWWTSDAAKLLVSLEKHALASVANGE